MSILVTGGAGYIGSHMVWELLDHDEPVVVLDNFSTGFSWAVPAGAELVEGDVGDMELVERIIRDRNIDSIIHFAGSVAVPESVSDPLKYYDNNTTKSRNLIAVATALVWTSSSFLPQRRSTARRLRLAPSARMPY
jgi:UDP-glucose 4-epimerase